MKLCDESKTRQITKKKNQKTPNGTNVVVQWVKLSPDAKAKKGDKSMASTCFWEWDGWLKYHSRLLNSHFVTKYLLAFTHNKSLQNMVTRNWPVILLGGVSALMELSYLKLSSLLVCKWLACFLDLANLIHMQPLKGKVTTMTMLWVPSHLLR